MKSNPKQKAVYLALCILAAIVVYSSFHVFVGIVVLPFITPLR